MKNLSVNTINTYSLEALKSPTQICIAFEENNEIYTCDNLTVTQYLRLSDTYVVGGSVDLYEFAQSAGVVVSLTYLSLSRQLCVALDGGEIVTVNCNDIGKEPGSVECYDYHGILAMEWSPDQELAVCVTKEPSMLLMSAMFDTFMRDNLIEEKFGEGEFINVGWGKKETQFHGSEGKEAAKAKVEISELDSVNIQNCAQITWRGDGTLFAVGFAINGIPRFKVYNREGILQFTSEKQPGLESNLSWRPSGNIIANTQLYPNKYVVAFFEKNGLKHRDFTLPFQSNNVKVKNLQWSNDSEILAVECYNDTLKQTQILLYTMNNYHWYLKQTLSYSSDYKLCKLMWDTGTDIQSAKKLHVIFAGGKYYTYFFNWVVNHSKGHDSKDDGVVAVIDGNKLLLTGFRQTVVPPPMSALQIETSANINIVIFGLRSSTDNINSNSFSLYLEDGTLELYSQISKMPLIYNKVAVINYDESEFMENQISHPSMFNNWLWVNKDLLLATLSNENHSDIIEYKLEFDDNNMKAYTINTVSSTHAIINMETIPEINDKAILQTSEGKLLEYSMANGINDFIHAFPLPCQKLDVCKVDQEIICFGLSDRNRLYMNAVEIAENVTSFFIHSDFILLTTLQHTLLSTELSVDGLKSLESNTDDSNLYVSKRKVERGSRLVIAVSQDTRTVLQLPRGNLEAIQPRALSLKIIGKYLNEHNYHAAFDLMRKQRINLNLIYDHNPTDFIENINVFLDKIDNNSWLSLFLSELENVDTTVTMYASSYVNETSKKVLKNQLKVVNICDRVREVIEKRDDKDKLILPMLTSYVKKNTVEDLEKALLIVKDIKFKESNKELVRVSSDEALKYLLYMIDVNNLCDVALGLYDFDLMLLVANKSQKDPKEYIPMLNEFNAMDEYYKRFAINKYLKRYKKAVESLVACGSNHHEELRNFVKQHGLYREALALFNADQSIYSQIAEDFGLHLKLNKQYMEAGLVYKRGGHVEKAIECFKEALYWEFAIQLAFEQAWTQDQLNILYWELAMRLKEEKRYKETLTLLERYCGNDEKIISCAVECGNFKTAIRLCSEYKKTELLDDLVKKALLEQHKNMQSTVQTNAESFTTYRTRLQLVREDKSRRAEMLDGLEDTRYLHKDSDLYSDTSSVMASSASRSSIRSFRSSKNRRKHERKLVSLKEGSQYEDVALITALYSLVTSSFDLRREVYDLNFALCWFDRDTDAIELQDTLEKLLKNMKDHFKDIWTDELVLEATKSNLANHSDPAENVGVPQGAASLEAHVRISPVIQEYKWKINL